MSEAPLTESQIAEVLALAEAATAADGAGALSEHALLRLRNGGHGLVITDGGDRDAAGIVAYAHLDPATAEESAAAELVVHPGHRGRGYGRALLRTVRERAAGPLRVWAHGDLPAAAKLAESEGLRRVRALYQMRRPAADPLPETEVADGVRLRTFVPGQDEAAWLRVNGRAFADHPEQGAWTLDDVRQREAESWFDPSGFFLAENDRGLAGFHWTKIHPDGLGEVYVVGVDPDAQGLGLGRTLTLAGLHHLRDRGVPAILLYVDESNTAAVRLYESLGFTRHTVDVMYGT
ncbi:mycothiol synthase [Actinomadura rugatobispora]|uniref:Mycothiol acetyltransferase n=1 Tax=Actinomadura rugatobispora TaxID=1994 RepID=A0ABW0ZYW0_9ACTN|nr:mycothiol synthase [Actinomadura rugatobispora]